ncbi:uncharacterized protein LOC106871135 [Octopus bimaculoides]|uniref:AB hydrolase-1 domain-containing protein n=1 Tax=Octopus bimaculoides TaxID=37653 RepID=A0A0L8HET3_OCTBM|nr:uncharacterized protein LOC106871135 [Octopus bimaculoides]|eukprot:XP_014772930.1 PREDICTED: uncharacterized protein LOC106871135 isoform X1 [Octopus bimaculoides]
MSLTRTIFTSFRRKQFCSACRLPLLHYDWTRLYTNQLKCSSRSRTIFTRPQHSQLSTTLNGAEPKDWMSSALPMRYVFVTTSESIWEDIPDGFVFDTGYVDSHAGSPYDPKIPLILAVHNLMSSHEDLIPLLAPLVLKNYRVIAVNLPSSIYTNGVGLGHDDGFLHSTTENAEFIFDFLKELKIPKVDVLLGHGTGCYPVVRLCAGHDLFKSAALISPAGHLPCPGVQPHLRYKLFTEVWDVPYLRPFAKVFVYLWKLKDAYREYTTESVIRGFFIINGIDFNSIGGYLVSMKSKEVPVGVLYCKDDKFTDTEILEHYCKLLGFEDQHFVHYDGNGQIIKQAETTKGSLHHGLILEHGNPFQVLKNPLLNLVEKLVNLSKQVR